MKTTIYELLGMVKDGKAPKRIKFENFIYIWRNTQKDYFCEQINHSLESIIGEYLFNNLNLEVEILENNGDIKEITLDDWAEITYTEDWELLTHDFNLNANTFVDKINELIKEVNKLKK